MAEDNNGWIESIDPTTGRTFYANRYTRTTQWDPPPGWKAAGSTGNGHYTHHHHQNHHNGSSSSSNGGNDLMSEMARARSRMEEMKMSYSQNTNGGGTNNHSMHSFSQPEEEDDDDAIPDGWEEMTDPTTGRTFYIDHATKTTTWERPRKNTKRSNGNKSNRSASNGFDFSGASASLSAAQHQQQHHHTSSSNRNSNGSGMPAAMMKLNQYGSHSHWDDDPHTGSRTSHSHHHDQESYMLGLDHNGISSKAGPPPLDFVVVSVPDALRMTCPGCYAVFTYTKRRHHCRLCGDVFCDACSSSRTILPLDGPEFATPVRVCDWCMKDVKKGNYFSLRRYLTPLQLYDPGAPIKRKAIADGAGSGEATKEITANTVAASLSSLSADVDAMVLEPMTFKEKITIPASVLVPAVGKHLRERTTAEYAIRVLASLLMLGNVVGDDSFALAVYEGSGGMKHSESINSVPSLASEGSKGLQRERQTPGEIVNDVLTVLEWNGTDDRSLSALEQAVKVIYYITEPSFIESAISKWDSHGKKSEDSKEEGAEEGGPIGVDEAGEAMHDFIQIDIHRAFRSMLDHATSSTSPSLQRWATATLRHLITEDRRRACVYSSGPMKYESFMTQLVSTGGIMILCSLLSADDAETRAHATSTLEAIVISTREIGLALGNTSLGRFSARVGRGTSGDSRIVDAIVSNGGCGPALAHLLISADESVAMMGCSFASSLISPLLTDPRGSGQALQQCIASSDGGGGLETKDDGLSSYRQAALALVVGESNSGSRSGEVSCLPSLIQILRSGADADAWGGAGKSRSIKLQVVAGECLAAIALAIGHIVGAASGNGHRSSQDSQYIRAKKALAIMEEERMYDVAYRLVTSASSHSLDPSRNTPQARLREAAGLMILALSSCSDVCSSYLIANKAVSNLLSIASESLNAESALRGEWASRGLCYLECAAELLLRAWKTSDASCLNLLLEALDAGFVGLASKMVTAKVHLKHHDRAYSQMRLKIAVCFMLAAMFGIAASPEDRIKNSSVGTTRLYSAIDADCAAALAYSDGSENGRTDLVASTVFLLSATLPYAQRFAMEDKDEPLPMMDMTEACLLAVGSMCGAATVGFVNDSPTLSQENIGEKQQDKFSLQRADACSMTCKALTTKKDRSNGALLPSVLIGALGMSLVTPALRATLAIAQNGDYELRGDLARSGALVPVGDILQQSLSTGQRYAFSVAIAIVRYCGPCANVESSDRGSVASLQNAIRTLSVLIISESGDSGDTTSKQRGQALLSLKLQSLMALEALSSNESLHATMISDAMPALTQLLIQIDNNSSLDMNIAEGMVCSALKTIKSLISLPSSMSSAAAKGMIPSLVKILDGSHNDEKSAGSKKQEVSLELLHSIALGKGDIAGNGALLSNGVWDSIASLLEEDSISPRMTRLCLDIIEFVLSDIDAMNSPHINPSLRDAMLRQFINEMSGHEQLLRTLIATMIAARATHDDELSISPALYGSPLLLPGDAGHHPALHRSIKALFNISSILCNDTKGAGKAPFLHAFMLKDVRGAAETVAFACSVFLQILMDELNGLCVPENPAGRAYFLEVKLPPIRSLLLEGLSLSLEECMSNSRSQKHAEGLICEFKIPQLCLSFCQSKTVSQAAFDLYENIVLPLPTEMLGDLLLSDKSSLVTLFDLVTGQNNLVPDYDHSKQTFALTLGNLAKAGFLSSAVERFGIRNNAIAALSAAMQGSEDGNIDENEDSLPRICVESLAAILCVGEQDKLEITALEARAIAMAIGKILSSTVLSRFFTQASLESTFGDSMDHTLDRSAISQSAEAKLLCSLASYPETLETLKKVGGLEAIGLIAHEGELAAIKAIQKACESSPKSVVDVDAHLSIMDALIQIESKLNNTSELVEFGKLRETVIKCLEIVTSLNKNGETKSAIHSAEQSSGCLTVAICIICASSKQLTEKAKTTSSKKSVSLSDQTLSPKKMDVRSMKEVTAPGCKEQHGIYENTTEDLQLGDLVLVDSGSSSSQPSPSKSSPSNVDQLEGIVAHLGQVKFAPGDDWIGIRLTGSSAGLGLGKNDGSVKGVHYFDCDEKNGVFARRNKVKKQKCVIETDTPEPEPSIQELDMVVVSEKRAMPPAVDIQREQMWDHLLLKDDLTLEMAALLLLLSFSSSKSHRDLLMSAESLIDDISGVIDLQSSALMNFQCKALDLLVSFTLHFRKPDKKLIDLLCSVAEGRTKMLQITRDKREQLGSKQLLASAISGLRNIFSSFMNASEKTRSLNIATDLFVFLADSLYKGSKSKRLAASITEGILYHELLSFLVLSIGSEVSMASRLSTKLVSSLLRFIMMTSGVTSLACHVPIVSEGEGGEYWHAALSLCLYYLSFNMIESSQDNLGTSYASLIESVEASPGSLQLCLRHVVDSKRGPSVSAKEILAKIELLPT